jgi:hypothetical protein
MASLILDLELTEKLVEKRVSVTVQIDDVSDKTAPRSGSTRVRLAGIKRPEIFSFRQGAVLA